MNKEEQNTADFRSECQTFWHNQRARCQSALVDHLLSCNAEQFHYDEIENLYRPSEEDGEEEDVQEICEWWLIDDWLADHLRKRHAPILENDYGTWWGRTTSQMVCMDWIIEDIVEEFAKEREERIKMHEARREA